MIKEEANEMEHIGVCPLSNTKSLKESVKIVRQHVIMAWAVPALGFLVSLILFPLVETSNTCTPEWTTVVDKILTLFIYFIAQVVVGHTSHSYSLKMHYYQQCFLLLQRQVQDTNTNLDPLDLIEKFDALQKHVNKTGTEFGLYLGIYTIAGVFSSSIFVGRIAQNLADENVNEFDLAVRLFFQVLFICPIIYDLVATASLGTESEKVMRRFLKRANEYRNDTKKREKITFAMNYFNLKLNVKDYGLRLYGIPLTVATVTQLFSLWGTFLSMVYAKAQSAP